jgi:hypothetical protein
MNVRMQNQIVADLRVISERLEEATVRLRQILDAEVSAETRISIMQAVSRLNQSIFRVTTTLVGIADSPAETRKPGLRAREDLLNALTNLDRFNADEIPFTQFVDEVGNILDGIGLFMAAVRPPGPPTPIPLPEEEEEEEEEV